LKFQMGGIIINKNAKILEVGYQGASSVPRQETAHAAHSQELQQPDQAPD
jgi:hypothetical protein